LKVPLPMPMNGLLLLDKDGGMTSHDVVRRLRRLAGLRRIGHAGTLDPMATGLLLMALGESTRLLEFLTDGEKAYRATLRLGVTTDTQDAEGEVRQRRAVPRFDLEELRAATRALTGVIGQLPPMYSALKRNGVPLYRLARRGVEVERETRQVEIRRLEIISAEDDLLTIEVDCSKGTYIRTLAHDLGQLLGTGAHLTSLRRLRSGSFAVENAHTLAQLEDAGRDRLPLLSPLQTLSGITQRQLLPEAILRLRCGVPPAINELIDESLAPEEGETVALLQGDRLLAVARFAPARLVEKRGDFELLKVLVQPE
jgi:tRNA pseudouridine55 synthase